ncbi:hypothetical protein LguiA_007437 [Lonicera macranthoides]
MLSSIFLKYSFSIFLELGKWDIFSRDRQNDKFKFLNDTACSSPSRLRSCSHHCTSKLSKAGNMEQSRFFRDRQFERFKTLKFLRFPPDGSIFSKDVQ